MRIITRNLEVWSLPILPEYRSKRPLPCSGGKLISEEFFVPQDWGLPQLHTQPYDPAVDHEWHEFEEFENTDDPATDGLEIGEFL